MSDLKSTNETIAKMEARLPAERELMADVTAPMKKPASIWDEVKQQTIGFWVCRKCGQIIDITLCVDDCEYDGLSYAERPPEFVLKARYRLDCVADDKSWSREESTK